MKLTTEFPEKFFTEEERSIVISEDRKRLWAVQLDLLIEFDRVCQENGIKYSLDAGTLLGAIRHKGFIPWDDDVDVVMLREEYEKLDKIASEKFSEPYFWQTFLTDPDHGRGFARLRNSSTTYILHSEWDGEKSFFSHNQGVFIDIFVCDKVPDDLMNRAKFMDALAAMQDYAWRIRMQKTIKWKMKLFLHPRALLRAIRHLICYKVLGIDRVPQVREKLNLMAQKYRGTDEENVSRLTFCANSKDRLSACVPRHFLEELTMVEFEGYKFQATKYWNEYLTIFYGNWHKHVIAHDPSGDAFIDLDNSYTKYIQ